MKIFIDDIHQKHLWRKYFYSLIFSLIIFHFNVLSQVTATAEIDKTEIRIGDPIALKLSLIIPNKLQQKFYFPSFKDTITSKIEIIDASKIDTTTNNENIIISQKLHISAYDSGVFVLPSIHFYYAHDTSQYVATNTLLITVHTVPTDTSETSVKDIKPILDEPFDIKWYFPLIYKILLALAIIAIIIYFIYRTKKKKQSSKEIEKPKSPPHIIALEKLNQIKAQQIWKEGKIKEYYSEISDTIREYIEGRFKVPALEQTSRETLQALKFKAIAPSTREKLTYILEISDLVKFAKFTPIEHDHINILQSSFDFVNDTMPDNTISTANPNTTQQNNPSNI